MSKKIFTVETSSYEEVTHLIHQLRGIQKGLAKANGFVGVKFNNSIRNMNEVFPLLEMILDSDIHSLYENLDGQKSFYTYLHCDPSKPLRVKHDVKHAVLASRFSEVTHEPFYVGKGTGDRCFDLVRNEGHRKIRSAILKSGSEVKIFKVLDGVSAAEALSLESKLIDLLGLKILSPNGLLVNHDEGAQPLQRRAKYPVKCLDLLKANGFRGISELKKMSAEPRSG